MQIILEENEIMDALNTYCSDCITIPAGKRIKVDFTVGRGGNGTRATIDFEDIEQAVTSKSVAEPKASVKEKKAEEPVKQVNDIVEDAAKEEPVKEEPNETKLDEAPVEETTAIPAGDSLFNI